MVGSMDRRTFMIWIQDLYASLRVRALGKSILRSVVSLLMPCAVYCFLLVVVLGVSWVFPVLSSELLVSMLVWFRLFLWVVFWWRSDITISSFGASFGPFRSVMVLIQIMCTYHVTIVLLFSVPLVRLKLEDSIVSASQFSKFCQSVLYSNYTKQSLLVINTSMSRKQLVHIPYHNALLLSFLTNLHSGVPSIALSPLSSCTFSSSSATHKVGQCFSLVPVIFLWCWSSYSHSALSPLPPLRLGSHFCPSDAWLHVST